MEWMVGRDRRRAFPNRHPFRERREREGAGPGFAGTNSIPIPLPSPAGRSRPKQRKEGGGGWIGNPISNSSLLSPSIPSLLRSLSCPATASRAPEEGQEAFFGRVGRRREGRRRFPPRMRAFHGRPDTADCLLLVARASRRVGRGGRRDEAGERGREEPAP